MDLTNKSISEIAYIIREDWGAKVYFGAIPYLFAMTEIDSVNDKFGCEDGKTQVLYFLSNANTYRGEIARAVKAELKKRIK